MHSNAGITILHVPYKGSADALTDLMGGRIDLMYDPVALPQIKSGMVKALAVTSEVRHPQLPNVPTLKEQGVAPAAGTWFGLFAPKGTPVEVVRKVAAALERSLAEPAARDQMAKFSQYPDFRGPGTFAKTIQTDNAFYKELIARLRIKLD